MKHFRTINDARDHQPVVDHLRTYDLVPSDGALLENYLGGDVFIPETTEEANQAIASYDWDDVAEDATGTYWVCFSATNNSGGPTYFIRKDLNSNIPYIYDEGELYNDDVSEVNYDPYSGCDTFETYPDDTPF